jgi:dihydroflavonol-4-reductase
MVNKAFTRKVVSRNINRPWRGDNTKSREKLGMNYRSLETTLHDHFQQLIDEGVVGSKKSPSEEKTQ